MKSLQQIIDEADGRYKTHSILPGFIGFLNDKPRFIHAIMERTVVIHKLGQPSIRSLVKLNEVFVWPKDITWVPRIKGSE